MTNSENMSQRSDSIDVSENLDCQVELSLQNLSSIERNPQIGFDPERLIPTPTYVEVGIEKLTILADTLGLNDKIVEIVEIFRALAASWSERKVGETTGWTSDVSDDGSPFEFSIALDPDQAELRVLVEAQGSAATIESHWQAGLELNQYLAEHYNISLDRFEQIADLFAPTNSATKFSMWHSACFYPDKPSAFKLYLNPQSQQPSRAAAVVEESLVRLGFTHAWPTLAETAAQRGPDKDEFVYFSLDLAAHERARVKVYIRHQDATPAELESALSAARNYIPGDAIEFCQAMAPGQTSFSAKSAITCFSLIEGDDIAPSVGTLYLPISNYATDDRAVCDRLDLYFIEHGLPISKYQSALQAFCMRPLEEGIGMHSYTSFRQEQQRRVGIYLNPEVNSVRPPKTIITAKSPHSISSAEKLIWGYYENYTIADHPFLQRLQRESVNTDHIWLLFMNFHEAVNQFTRRLATVISRIEDERICCILANQLNEELGDGNIERIHKKLYAQLINNIEPWRMKCFSEEMLIPGEKFSQSWEDIYAEPNPYTAVGAAILMEIQAKQFDLCLGKEFRKTDIELSKIKWLILHEEVEVDHADETLFISRFIDDTQQGVEAAIDGSRKARAASWKFLDGIYRLCYGILPATA
jgi:DMATS type aromatic prenyltransferase